MEGNTLPLAEGMVFSDEPGVYFPGQFGIRMKTPLSAPRTVAVA